MKRTRPAAEDCGGFAWAPAPPGTPTADALADAIAVVVVTERRTSRRIFLSLSAAQRAVERARDRGDVADLVLVRLVPVGRTT